jgi:signal transduction histidine kinase
MAKGRIMIVEDEGITALAIRKQLESIGYEIPSVFNNGEAALAGVLEANPDLILMDIRLAGVLDGVETATLIRRQLDVPIVYLTAYSDEETFQRAKITDSFGYVLKPFHQSILEITIEMAFYKHKTDKQLKEYANQLETKIRERTQQLTEALAVLEKSQRLVIDSEKMVALGRLASGVAHELRNPLAVISNAVYFLRETYPQNENKTKEYLQVIENRVQEAEKIVTDLLDFTRGRPLQRDAADPNDLVEKSLIRQPAPENIEVVLNLADDTASVLVDPQQIIQILSNLLLNAYQAMPDGGKLSIDILPTDHGGELCISVADNGVGINQQTQRQIFEPFYSTKSQGIGLGLAVCKNLAAVNGGRIELESTFGQGSTFFVVLKTVPDAVLESSESIDPEISR